MHKLIFLLFLLVEIFSLVSVTPTYSPSNQMRSGTWTAVTALRSEVDPAVTYSIVYSSAIPPASPAWARISAVTSVSTFDCLSSTEFSFNTTCSLIDLTGFSAHFLILGNTYLNKIKFDYLAVVWNDVYDTDLLYRDCFLTSNLSVVTSTRSQSFSKQVLASTIVDGTIHKVQSFITGMKFFNNKDVSKKVSVQSYIANNTNFITQQVYVTGNTVLEWICLGTVIVKSTYSDFQDQVLPYELGTFVLDRVGASIDAATFPSNYLTKYDEQDNKFFGLIEIEMYLGKPYQIVKFLSENSGSIEPGYQSLAVGGKMAYFFLASRSCPPTNLMYSLVDNECWDTGCPDGQVQQGAADLCVACHFSCQTCSGPLDTQCLTCDSADNRGTMTGGKCPCKNGYVENDVEVCPPCSDFIPNCDTCDSKTNCLTCSSTIFVFNPTSIACECPAGSFYVTASNVCAPYPGCTEAQHNTNFIHCKVCDRTQHFYLDSALTCKCEQYFTVSGSTCVDTCGDGVNPLTNSSTYCDDGNPNNGDGCSSTCAVQTNYGCFNPPGILKSFCSPVKTFTLKFMYAERIINENAGDFLFFVSPVDTQLADPSFTYYVQTDIPHTTAIGVYDPSTSILRIKTLYTQTIEDQTHELKMTLDPYKMSVAKQQFTLKSSGVNYDLTIDDNPKVNTYLWYFTVAVSGFVVLTALIVIFLNYKIAGVELLLSSQLVYMAVIAAIQDNISIYPLTGLKYLAGFNTLKMFDINKYNANTPFLLTSNTFAQFLLNFNIMAAIIVLVIFILIPLKINVWIRTYQRTRFTSPEMQQKLMHEQPTTSLSQLSANIKTAQLIADTYVDRVYFGFSLIVFMPIVLYFSIQLGFIGKVGRYELSSFANIMLSILLLMLDFCFFILVFQDTDKKLKMFNFGSKKLKSYPNRLMMFYFGTCCLFTIVLLSEFTTYVLLGMTIITGIYVFVQSPYEKLSLEYFDSVSKPIIALLCQVAVKITSFLPSQNIFIPIIVDALLFISAVVTIIRVIRIKMNRAQVARKMIEDADGDDQGDVDFEKNMKNTNDSDFDSQKNKKLSAKIGIEAPQQKALEKTHENNQNDDSAGELNKDESPNHDQIGEEDEDQLTRIKRSLRQDLKKRRGIVQKANDDGPTIKTKKTKSKKIKEVDFFQDPKEE